jgi:cobalt/nickel transport system permease protein
LHIPDGFLSGEAAAIGWTAGAAGLAFCLHRVRAEQRERDLPVAGLAAAFFLVGDAPLFPVTIGTQGHLLGGLLAVALLGPWLGALTIAVVSAIQALAFGDGGITTLGLAIVNLALVPAFVGYPLLAALKRALPSTPTGTATAAGISAWVCVVLAALLFFGEFAVGAVVDIDLHAVGGSIIGVYALIGIVEGLITAFILRAILGVRPDLVRIGRARQVVPA